MESVSIIFITLPILFPLITQLGFDPIWFNVVMLLNLELALEIVILCFFPEVATWLPSVVKYEGARLLRRASLQL